MRKSLLLSQLAAGTALVLASPSLASAQGGVNGDLLKSALQSTANGDCPSAIMTPMVVGACLQSMPGTSQKLTSLGAISDEKYLGNQQTPTGIAEVYLVTFANGKMTWLLGTGADGKLIIFWSPG